MDLNFNFTNTIKRSDLERQTAEPEVVESTPFDADKSLVIAKKHESFLTIKSKIEVMKKQAVDLKITDQATFDKAMEMSIQIRSLTTAADDAKKKVPVYVDAQKLKNGIDKFVLSELKKPLESIAAIVNPKISFYSKTQAELERRKRQKEAEEAAAKAKSEAEKAAEEAKAKAEAERKAAIELQAKLNLQADEAGVERVSVPIPSVPDIVIPSIVAEVPVTQKSEKVSIGAGSAKIEGVWICVVENPDDVPRQYCSPNEKLLDQAVKSGIREIPGCKIEESFDPKIRLSRKRKESDMQF